MKEITSPANPLVKQWRQLLSPSGRRAHGMFLAEGNHLCGEAVHAGQARTLLIQKDRAVEFSAWLDLDADIFLVSAQVLAALCDSRTTQGCLAVCPLPESGPLQKAGPRLLALNRLQDPGNVGTILRTLDAAGFDGLLLDPGCADPFSPKAVRASMGAVFRVPVYPCEDLFEALRVLDQYTIVAGDLGGSPYYEHPPFGSKVCLLVGNEGAGLDSGLLSQARYRLKLPIPGGAESLNAAVAAGLMIYDVLMRGDQ